MSSSTQFPVGIDDDDGHVYDRLRPPRNPYELNSKIMLTALISLSVVVVLVIMLHLYARYVLRRQARRRMALRQLGLTVTTHVNSSVEPPKTGLDPTVIATLPLFVFKQTDGQDHQTSTIVECAVCLSMLENEEMVRLLPNCTHNFHADCIDKWFSSHTTCPICRTEAEPRQLLQPEPREAPSAPVIEPVCSNSSCMEGTSSSMSKVNNSSSSSRLSSFRRMLSRERSSRRIQSCSQAEDGTEDLERQ